MPSRLTSITESKAADFLRASPDKATLSCDRISGLRLQKLRGNGFWQYRYTGPDGKRKLFTIGKFSIYKPATAAKLVLECINDDLDPVQNRKEKRLQAQSNQQELRTRTYKQYLDNYYSRHMESWAENSAKENYNRLANKFAKFSNRDMASICKQDIDEWQRSCEQNGLGHTTIKRNFSALKAMLNHAVGDGVLEANPISGHKLLPASKESQDRSRQRQKQTKNQRKMFSNHELKQISEGLDAFSEIKKKQRRSSRSHGKPHLTDFEKKNFVNWFVPFCLIALHTGLRPGDLYTLQWEHISFNSKRLTKTLEKSRRRAEQAGKPPSRVELHLNATVLDVLQKWRIDNPETEYVFESQKTGTRLNHKSHVGPWKMLKQLAGIDSALHFYSFRHNFISSLMADGVPVFDVAKLVGHRDVRMIMENYGHLSPGRAEEWANVMEKRIAGA